MIASKKYERLFRTHQTIKTHQEERVGQECVQKHSPANPATSSLAAVEDLGDNNGDNDAHKLVARVCDQIQQLRLARDAQEVTSQLEGDNLDNNNNEADRGRLSEELRLELATETGDQGREEDICNDCHDCSQSASRSTCQNKGPTHLGCTCRGC